MMFHYRPYARVENGQGNGQHSDDECVKADDKQEFSQTLLYVHQEHWHQQVLSRYENMIVLMDATYKTTKYV